MKFILRWLKRKLDSMDEDFVRVDYPTPVGKKNRGNSLTSIPEDSFHGGVKFSMYAADGGHVVETSHYDKNHDRQTALYIITSDQDIGERLNQIYTFEAIKR